MSIEASSFVLGLTMGRGNGVRKLILLGYANHADKHGRDAYPSTRTIADYAECDIRTVQRHIGWLLERGYLHEGDQQMVDHLDPQYRPIVYDVAMSTDQIHRWADTDPSGGSRTRAAQAGRRGGHASAQPSRGDNLSPLPQDESLQVSRGDGVSLLETGPRGDNAGTSGVTHDASRGDTGDTRTIQEPSTKPSSSSSSTPADTSAAQNRQRRGGMNDQSPADALDLLPESVRNHPSVIPSAIIKRLRVLDHLGWARAEIRRRLAGVETADTPGAAALTRLDTLAKQNPPPPLPSPRPHPRWCGHCDERTRLREDPLRDGRPYRCPQCHPLTTAPAAAFATSSHAASSR